MAYRVLVVHSEQAAAKQLAHYFTQRGGHVWSTSDAAQALHLMKAKRPHLALVDLNLPDDSWSELLTTISQDFSATNLIAITKHPDLHREMLAREHGANVFLRPPFTAPWISNALKKLRSGDQGYPSQITDGKLPKVRIPMRFKITFPFALLAVLFAITAAFLGSRLVLETIRERFTNQLIDAGVLVSDWMVQEENRLLETLRLVANTEGLAEAIQGHDADRLQQLALPLAVNYQVEDIEILDLQGTSVLSLRHLTDGKLEDYATTKGDGSAATWDFVHRVLNAKNDEQGDKFAGLELTPWGDFFFIAGPVYNSDNQLVGAILVGKSLSTLARQVRQDTLAQITIYDSSGFTIASTVLIQAQVPHLSQDLLSQVLDRQNEQSVIRDLEIASASYSEILGPWEARGGVDLGVMGVALAQNFFVHSSTVSRFQAFFVVALTFLGVIALGLYLARQITAPLSKVVQAFSKVAQGNLEVRVPIKGNDEVAVMAHAFNFMVSGLQEGFIYRDILGRTASPEVRDALRKSFASGDLRLKGHSTEATVLMSDIRGFTSLAEKQDPPTVLKWLNEYFGELVPIIISNGGVVDKFEGDSLVAFFGILPTPQPPELSAYQASQAALAMLQALARLNQRRAGRGEPTFITGIGINTGSLTAGSLGTLDRLNFTVIGDTVNTAQRIKEITREFGESAVVISEHTLAALGQHREEFRFESLGEHAFKGKADMLWLYRLWPAKAEQHTRSPEEELYAREPA